VATTVSANGSHIISAAISGLSADLNLGLLDTNG